MGKENSSLGEENNLFFTANRGCLSCVAKVALTPDENAFLLSSLAEAPVWPWGGDGVPGPYQAPSCLITKGQALGSVATPCSLAAAAVGSSRPGPRSSLLPPVEGVLGGKWGICCFTRATPAPCQCGTAAPEAEECWCWLKGNLHFDLGLPALPIRLGFVFTKRCGKGEERLLAGCLRRKTGTCAETWGCRIIARIWLPSPPEQPLSGDSDSDRTAETRSVISLYLKTRSRTRWNAGSHVPWLPFQPAATDREVSSALARHSLVPWRGLAGRRALTRRVRPSCRRSLYINLVGLWAILVCATLCGLSLYSIYKDCDPWTAKQVSALDQVRSRLSGEGGEGAFLLHSRNSRGATNKDVPESRIRRG